MTLVSIREDRLPLEGLSVGAHRHLGSWTPETENVEIEVAGGRLLSGGISVHPRSRRRRKAARRTVWCIPVTVMASGQVPV